MGVDRKRAPVKIDNLIDYTYKRNDPQVASQVAYVLCSATAVVRDAEGQAIRGADGKALRRPCKKAPVRGSNVCEVHGAGAPQVRASAEKQLASARDELMEILLRIARNPEDQNNFKALTWALERSGFKPGMDIKVDSPKWQKLLRGMFESPKSIDRGDIIDAEVVDEDR